MRIADTSALYAFFHPTDAHHEAAMAAMRDARPIMVPGEILTELEGIVRLRSGPEKATGVVEDLLNLRHVRLAGAPPWEAILACYQKHRALSLADAVVVAQCILHDASPFTFDDALRETVR